MTVEQLLALDDSDARTEATRELASAVMLSATFAPLRRAEPPVTSWISRSQWTADVGAAALRGWIHASGLGWVETDHAEPGFPFEAFFDAESPAHRQVATSLYLWALPRNCRTGDVRLSDFLSDSVGEKFATFVTSAEHLSRLAVLDDIEQVAAAGSILGKLHWLAPAQVPAVAEAFAARLRGYAQAPLPPPESRTAAGFLLPFCFEPSRVRAFLEPMMAEAIHSAMSAGDIDLLEYSWSASQSAALALPLTDSLSASSFAAGVNRLSLPERALLTEALLKVMPLLSRAIGPFVERPLKDLYNAAHAENQVP